MRHDISRGERVHFDTQSCDSPLKSFCTGSIKHLFFLISFYFFPFFEQNVPVFSSFFYQKDKGDVQVATCSGFVEIQTKSSKLSKRVCIGIGSLNDMHAATCLMICVNFIKK